MAGDAFAAHPHGLAPVQAAFDEATTLTWPLEIAPSRFGVRVQESAAVVVALSVIYADPIAAMGRADVLAQLSDWENLSYALLDAAAGARIVAEWSRGHSAKVPAGDACSWFEKRASGAPDALALADG